MTKNNDLPRWDMTNVYPSLDSTDFKKANQELNKLIEDLEKYIADNGIGPSQTSMETDPAKLAGIIAGYIDRANAASNLSRTIKAYTYSFISTNSYDTKAQKAFSEWEGVSVRLKHQQDVLFKSWVGKLGDDLSHIIEQNGTVKAHSFPLTEIVEQSKYLMSVAEEDLAGKLSLSGIKAWSRLQGTVTSQLRWDIENAEGKIEKEPITAIINLRSHPDEIMRKRGYEAELEAWKSVENQLAACMNGVKGSQQTLNDRRGREDAVHFSIDQYRLDRQSLEAMLGAMRDSFPMFRAYFKAKAKRLGKESLAWWDLYAPIGKTNRTYTYDEAKQFIIDNFAAFSQELSDYAKQAFENNWIDVGPRDGKENGAFCMYIPAKGESRILMNFDGSLGWVTTLAHELGHGYHNQCLIGKTMMQRETRSTLAETASVLCETIVSEAAIKDAANQDEELAILENSLIGDSQVVVDIYSRYLFEKEVFERRADSELSADDLCEIMERAQVETYGDGLDENHLQKYMWTWKPHYYESGISFYNYPYAFGLLFSTGLYAIYQERGDAFIPEYDDLLASTGLGYAADLAARFDIDLRSPAFWEGSLKVIGEKVERYLRL